MISVVLPVHNAEATLEECISSIVKQTYRAFELIVVNNASTDRSNAVIQSWINRDKRIRKVDEPRKGLVFAFNRGMAEVKGEWIARMDADDVAHPERFEKQINYLLKNSNIDVLGTQIQMFGSKTKTTDFPLTHDGIVIDFCFRNCIAHPTVLIRRERIKFLGYPQGYDISDDYVQWVRWSQNYQFANLAEPLLNYRVHSSQITRSKAEIVKKTEMLVLKEAFSNQEIFLTEMDLRIHQQFCRYLPFHSGIEILREAHILNKLWKRVVNTGNKEGRNLIYNHWSRLIEGFSEFPFERALSHLFSSIPDSSFHLFRKSRRTQLRKITGL
ncbi:MAG: glycosyltransferase [Verrucomicrobiota bacterium]